MDTFLDEENVVYICVFREPERTIDSLITASKGYHDVTLSEERAANIWYQMYSHILENHSARGEWLFLHFNQITEGEGMSKLKEALHIADGLDSSFPDKKLCKSKSETREVSPKIKEMYQKLCARANYKPSREIS